MLHAGELGFAGTVRKGAVGHLVCRMWLVLSPLVVLHYMEGRSAYLLVLLALALGGLASTLLGSLVERRVRARLYRMAGASLSGASGMVALPLPESEPELALARGIYAAARTIGAARPVLMGEGLALVVLALVAAIMGERIFAIPLGCGAFGAGLAYLLLRRSAARREARQEEAALSVFRHIVGFLSERQERIAYGLRAAFVARLDALLVGSARAELSATWTRVLTRRLPIATGVALAVLSGYLIGLRTAPPSAMFAIAAWAQGAGMVLAAVADNIRSSREAQAFLHLVSLPRQTFAGTRAVAAPNQIQARNLGFTYDQGPVVGAASFVAEKGAPLVLRGANGSGKSTILRLLAGLALPTSGELRVDGIGIQDLSMDEWRGHIVYLSQSPSFDPTSSVRDVLAAMLPGKTDASYLHALESVGFDSPTAMLDRPIGALSSGQRRRVHLARAIAADRPVMILDEPEAGLDAATEERVRGYLFEMAKTRLVILATHSSGYGPGVRLGVVGEGT